MHRGSFFHFFPTKDDLLLEVLAMHAQSMRARMLAGPFHPDLPPLSRFGRFFGQLAAHLRQQRNETGAVHGCPIGNVVIELATRSPAVRAAAAAVFDVMRSVFEQTLRDAKAAGELPPATDPATGATAILAYMQGLAVVGKAYGNLDELERIGARVLMLVGGSPLTPAAPPRRSRTRRVSR